MGRGQRSFPASRPYPAQLTPQYIRVEDDCPSLLLTALAKQNAVLLLAEKREASNRRRKEHTLFALLNGPDLSRLKAKRLATAHIRTVAIRSVTKSSVDLRPEVPWTPYFTAPKEYFDLAESGLAVPLRELAGSRIGLQTFAKPVFILPRSEADALCLEREFLRPGCGPSPGLQAPVRHRLPLPDDTPKIRGHHCVGDSGMGRI